MPLTFVDLIFIVIGLGGMAFLVIISMTLDDILAELRPRGK